MASTGIDGGLIRQSRLLLLPFRSPSPPLLPSSSPDSVTLKPLLASPVSPASSAPDSLSSSSGNPPMPPCGPGALQSSERYTARWPWAEDGKPARRLPLVRRGRPSPFSPITSTYVLPLYLFLPHPLLRHLCHHPPDYCGWRWFRAYTYHVLGARPGVLINVHRRRHPQI